MILHKAGPMGNENTDQKCKHCECVLRLRNYDPKGFVEEGQTVGEVLYNGKQKFLFGNDVYLSKPELQKFCYAILDEATRQKYLTSWERTPKPAGKKLDELFSDAYSVYSTRLPTLEDYDLGRRVHRE